MCCGIVSQFYVEKWRSEGLHYILLYHHCLTFIRNIYYYILYYIICILLYIILYIIISTRKRAMRCFSPAILLQHHNTMRYGKLAPTCIAYQTCLLCFHKLGLQPQILEIVLWINYNVCEGSQTEQPPFPCSFLKRPSALDLQNDYLVHPVFSGIFPAIKFWTFVNQMISREQSRTICTYPTISKYLDIQSQNYLHIHI